MTSLRRIMEPASRRLYILNFTIAIIETANKKANFIGSTRKQGKLRNVGTNWKPRCKLFPLRIGT